jgi:hypothetical protein
LLSIPVKRKQKAEGRSRKAEAVREEAMLRKGISLDVKYFVA